MLLSLSLPWSEERLFIHVQPGAVLGLLMDFCQHDGSTLHTGARFVSSASDAHSCEVK